MKNEIMTLCCLAIGLLLIYKGMTILTISDFLTKPYSILFVGCGLLIIIFGFSPRKASEIIKAIVEIVTAPLKAIFK
jgi:hypothetical protein